MAAVDLDGHEVTAAPLPNDLDARRRAWARAQGCRCDVCSLAEYGPPVESEIRPGKPLAIAEAPGNDEEIANKPQVGASGRELMRALEAAGLSRYDVSLSNILACRPPGDWRAYQKRLGRENAARKKRGLAPHVSPIEACRPRWEKEMAEAPSLLLLGATALEAATRIGCRPVRPHEDPSDLDPKERVSGDAGVSRLRGFPLALGSKPAIAAWHPAFILRARQLTEVFRADVAKALRYATGRLTWREPVIVFDPDLAELDRALVRFATSRIVAVDTETDGIDNETCALRCVGLGVPDFGLCVGFRSVEQPPRTWRCDPARARERLANFLASHPGLALHNQAFDRRVLERHGMPLPTRYDAVLETLAADHVVNSEWPHDLGFLSSLHTDAPRHKDVDHSAWKSDRELHSYCVRDCCVTASLAPSLLRGIVDSGQRAVYESDLELQRLAVGMHRAGIRIDEGERRRHATRLEAACVEAQERAARAVGRAVPALSNMDAVREFLFGVDGLRLAPTSVETGSGAPSVDKDALYEILERLLPDGTRAFVEANLDFRRAYKKLTAYTGRLVGSAWRGGMDLDRAGRVHPFYNATTTVVGRLSCSEPAIQTWPATRDDPDSLRSMAVAAPGNVFVGCDMDQLHLRLIAVRANDVPWLDAFVRGLDVHRVNASLFFRTGYDGVRPHERQHMKTSAYLFVYVGQAEKALKLLHRMRDPKTGVRPYADMTLGRMIQERDRFLATHPALPVWWDAELARFRRDLELRSMILGRRKRFLAVPRGANDDRSISELVNFPILATEGDWMGGAGASGRTMDLVGWPWEGAGRGMGGPGIILQNHDSIMVEVSEYRALEAAQALEQAMCGTFSWGDRSVPLTAKAKIGKRWSELA